MCRRKKGLGKLLTRAPILLFLALSPLASRAEQYLQLRVRQGGGDITFQAPRQLVSEMAKSPTGTTVSIGSLKGRDVRVSLDKLVKSLAQVPSSSKEILLFARETDLGPVSFYALPIEMRTPSRGGTPHFLGFDLIRKDGGEGTSLTFPLMGASVIGETIAKVLGFNLGSDMGPFLDNCLSSAREVGSGHILQVTGSDANIALTTR